MGLMWSNTFDPHSPIPTTQNVYLQDMHHPCEFMHTLICVHVNLCVYLYNFIYF